MRDEIILTAIVRGLVDRLGRKEHHIKRCETFESMGLDELDMTELEASVEECLGVRYPLGIKLTDTIHSVAQRLRAGKW